MKVNDTVRVVGIASYQHKKLIGKLGMVGSVVDNRVNAYIPTVDSDWLNDDEDNDGFYWFDDTHVELIFSAPVEIPYKEGDIVELVKDFKVTGDKYLYEGSKGIAKDVGGEITSVVIYHYGIIHTLMVPNDYLKPL